MQVQNAILHYNCAVGIKPERESSQTLAKQFVAFLALWLISVAVILGGAEALIRRYSPGPSLLAVIAAAFALQFALYWLPGFPILRTFIEDAMGRQRTPLAIGVVLIIPYLVYGAGTGAWRFVPVLALCGLVVIVLGIYAVFPPKAQSLSWQDITVMALVALPLYAGWYREVWPFPVYLDFMARLFAVALAAFAIISVRRLAEVGYDWRLVSADWLEGLKQLGFYAAIGIPLGFALHFIAWNPQKVGGAVAVSFVGIFLFIAVPEELFFRGMLQNLLEKSMDNRYTARAIASAIFGLSHIHHGFPNWRYAIMAAVAGWFYGTAWHVRRSIVAAAVTHAAVDTLWHHFLTV